MVALASIAGPACAQIYAGGGDRGAVVLSNFPSDETPRLLIAAPPVPVAPPAAPAATVSLPAGLGAGASKAARYTPMIDKVAREVALSPKLLHAVIEVESGYEPRAVSRKGAVGLMQLMPATAQRFGVRDAMDPAQNIRGGALYLKWLLDYFRGDLRLALAAYNAGELAVVRAGYRIPQLAETLDYVPKVLARINRPVVG